MHIIILIIIFILLYGLIHYYGKSEILIICNKQLMDERLFFNSELEYLYNYKNNATLIFNNLHENLSDLSQELLQDHNEHAQEQDHDEQYCEQEEQEQYCEQEDLQLLPMF